jgi:hypothetical protein
LEEGGDNGAAAGLQAQADGAAAEALFQFSDWAKSTLPRLSRPLVRCESALCETAFLQSERTAIGRGTIGQRRGGRVILRARSRWVLE